MIIFFSLGRSFPPPFNEGSFTTINVATMPGISLEESDKVGRNVEEILLTVPEIQTVVRKDRPRRTGRTRARRECVGVGSSIYPGQAVKRRIYGRRAPKTELSCTA
ncbi:MAG: hypothetical protein ACLR8Y_19780 [Alistipes indistinctus]